MTYDDELEPEHDEEAEKRFQAKAAKHKAKESDGRPDLIDEPVGDLGDPPGWAVNGKDAPDGWRKVGKRFVREGE